MLFILLFEVREDFWNDFRRNNNLLIEFLKFFVVGEDKNIRRFFFKFFCIFLLILFFKNFKN